MNMVITMKPSRNVIRYIFSMSEEQRSHYIMWGGGQDAFSSLKAVKTSCLPHSLSKWVVEGERVKYRGYRRLQHALCWICP